MRKYEVTIIGSSPLCIAEAIYHASTGKSVCIIEKGPFGGSWRYINAFGLKNLELGPHVFNGPRNGIKAMELFNLAPIKAQIWYFDILLNRLYKKNLRAEKHLEKLFSWIKKLWSSPANSIKAAYNGIMYVYCRFLKRNEAVYYLKRGTFELIETLLSHPTWKNVHVIQDKAQSISIEKNQNTSTPVIINLSSGKTILSEHVVLTSGSDLNLSEIYADLSDLKEQCQLKQHIFQSHQILLLLKNNKKNLRFTFFVAEDNERVGHTNFLKKKSIKYLNDITPYVSRVNDVDLRSQELSILTLSVNSQDYTTQEGIVDLEKIVIDLIELGFISKETEIIDTYSELFEGRILEPSSIELFNSSVPSNIRILYSENILESFAVNYDRWKQIKYNNKF